jgi:hypothetical protein
MIFQNTTATVSVTIICSSASERGRSSSPSPRLPSRISLMLGVLSVLRHLHEGSPFLVASIHLSCLHRPPPNPKQNLS